ncbi:MAG: DUF58 domain-containing protein [Ilumatobacteraceae bacterium]
MAIELRSAVPGAERRLRTLELAIERRLDGRLHGEYRGLLPGPGWEAGDGRAYQPGDEVRRIDWSLTARSNQVQVRDTIADRELETWAVIDGSASLDFGTDQWEKRDLAIAATATFGFLSCLGGSRFGVIVAEQDGVTVMPPGSGRDHVRRLLRRLMQRPSSTPGAIDLPAAIERIGRLRRRPGAVVLVSDLIGDDAWVRPIRAHAQRCRTLVVEVRDDRDDHLPPVGFLTLVDPETGRTHDIQTNDRALRTRFADAATERRGRIADAVRSSGSDHLVVNTDNDWLDDILRHHHTNRRLR